MISHYLNQWWPHSLTIYSPSVCGTRGRWVNTLRPRQDGHHFPDDIFICIFLNENEWHSIKISLKFVPTIPINNIPTLVKIMAWRRPGNKPLSEPMMVRLPTHICISRPQWVNSLLDENMWFLFLTQWPFHMFHWNLDICIPVIYTMKVFIGPKVRICHLRTNL